MIKMIAGKSYYTRSICDHNCIFKITVLDRTEKMAKIKDMFGKIRRTKIKNWRDVEYIRDGNYSMSPIWNATDDKELNIE